MAIWTHSDDNTTARYERADLDGNQVYFALEPNPNLADRYRENGKPINHDRAIVAELPHLSPDDSRRIIRKTMYAGYKAAIKPPGMDLWEEGVPEDTKIAGATTGTIALYDPQAFTLSIGSKGDSPGFLIFDDGKKVVAVKVTSDKDTDPKNRNVTYSCLNEWHNPVRDAGYHIGDSNVHEGPIQLDKLVAEAITAHSLDKGTLKTHLFIGSDGILKPRGNSRKDEEQITAERYAAAKQLAAPNVAEAMAKVSYTGGGSDDNISIILISDIASGKGKPIGAVVCDGFMGKGNKVAAATINAMETRLKREVAKEQRPTTVVAEISATELSVRQVR